MGNPYHQTQGRLVNVYVPYTRLCPETKKALDATKHSYTPINVSKSDETYWELLNSLWSKGETFAIVEHDIVIHKTALQELADCPRPWCAFPVPYFSSNHVGLGCVKFGSDLIKRFPNALDEVALMFDSKHPPKHWCRLDAWLQTRVLPQAERHVHQPPLGHVRSGSVIKPSHGCL